MENKLYLSVGSGEDKSKITERQFNNHADLAKKQAEDF